MMSYLQMQELWEVVDGRWRIPSQPAVVDPPTTTSRAAQKQYDEDFKQWNTADNKAIGAITLRIAANLRHHRATGQTSRTFWSNLKTAFGSTSMSAIYADYKQVIGLRLSGGNPVPEMERMAELFGRLAANNFTIPDALQGLTLLAAIPAKWDSVAQLFMQRSNLASALTFANVRETITQEYERSVRPIDRSAHKLSAVKRKGPDPAYRPQQQQQQQPGTSRQHQQQSQEQGGQKPKRCSGRQEKQKQERCARKQSEFCPN